MGKGSAVKLREKLGALQALEAEGRPVRDAPELPLVPLTRSELGLHGHATKARNGLPYLFERHTALHAPWHSTVPSGEQYNFIGLHSYMGDGGYLRDRVLIGRYCSIGRRVTLGAGGHDMARVSTSPALSLGRMESPRAPGRRLTLIGSDCWIGDGAVILPGLELGPGSVIGANAVVTRDVVPYGIYAGSPARLLRRRFPDQLCAALLASEWWELPYDVLREQPVNDPEAFLRGIEGLAPGDEATYVGLHDPTLA
jgi:virginiamycin A acetyltransferase